MGAATIDEDRPITEREAELVRWLLVNAPTAFVPSALEEGVAGLRVVGRCSCGCASVDFEKQGQSGINHPIADAIAKTAEGLCGLILWGREDAVTGLEIYEIEAGSADSLPPPDTLLKYG